MLPLSHPHYSLSSSYLIATHTKQGIETKSTQNISCLHIVKYDTYLSSYHDILASFDNCPFIFKTFASQGTWVAQSVTCATLDFSSGHDLMVHEFQSRIGLCADSVEPAWDFSLPLSLPLTGLISVSFSK